MPCRPTAIGALRATGEFFLSPREAVQSPQMLIILLDEPGLSVFQSAADAELEIEPVDAESIIRAAFDDSAVPYRVEWVHPRTRRKAFFGLLEIAKDGSREC